MPVCAATASACRACAPCRSLCERRISSPVATTVASTSSPTATRSLPSGSVSSARSIHASPLPPTSTKTFSASMWMTRPFTTWPTSSARRADSRANSVAKSSLSLMSLGPTIAQGALYVAAWTVMMAAMMLPSAAPMIALYAATQRTVGSAVGRLGRVALFTLTYLSLWTVTGVPTYLASVVLGAITAQALAYIVAGLLVAAGLFQLSPLKQMCLRGCRSPVGFLLGRWRSGWRGGLAMGWAHAAHCLGCCWALMAVLVVAGAMGLPWVLLIGLAVAAEKLLPRGEWIGRAIGGALVLLGAAG